ncbi:MAG TPA: protein kinase [bacterium]|nr:protein kinase [bacterium]
MVAHWRVVRSLGEGGAGEVSLAATPENETVAVKVLKDPASIALLEHEAKILVKLRHTAIAALLGYAKNSSDIFGSDLGPCFWMEFVEGEDLFAAAERAGRNAGEISKWLAQALEALDFLHAQGVLHGDLAPGNVRISKTSLKLIDFGMANLAGQASAFNAATLLYLAPERVGGKNTAATDIFSLGTLFYEALAGIHPRAGCSSLREMVRRPAAPLIEARPDLKTEHALLARVVDRMILIDPNARFAEASEVLEALRGGVSPAASEAPKAFYPIRMAGEAGRRAASVEEAVGRLGMKSKLFALHGVTGTGKKRLLKETAFHAALSGLPVREWGASQFREGMEALAFSSGLVLFRDLEDVAPAELARLLHLRRRQLPAAGLMAFWEWNEDRAGDESRRVLEGLSAHPDVEDIALKNLDENETNELVRAALGDEAASASGGDFFRLTAGNPLALLEILSEARGRGDPAEAIRGLKGADEILKRRIADLPADERRLLELLAVGHWSVDLDDLFRAHGGETEALFPALDRLIAKGLAILEADSGRYRVATEALETAVLKSLGEEDEIDRHRSWWAVLGTRVESPQKLHHAAALRDLDYVGRFAPETIEALRAARRFEAALRLSEAALEALKGSGDAVTRSRLLRIRGNLFNEIGRYPEALGIAEEVFQLAAPDEPMPVKTVKHWLVTGLIHQNLGDRAEAEKRFERLLAEARRFAADVPAFYALRALSLLGIEALRRGELKTARQRFEEGLLSPEAKGWRRAEILRNLAVVDHREGDAAASFRRLDEARAIYRAEKNAEGEYACWLEQGNLSLSAGDFAAAEASYARAEAIARERDDDLLLAGLWNNQGVMERKRGNLSPALERLQDALALFRPLGNAADLAECLKQNAITDAEVGRFEAAASKVAEIRRLAARFPGAGEKAKDAEAVLRRLKDGIGAASDEADGRRLKDVYDRLPKALQVSFEERFDYKRGIASRRP